MASRAPMPATYLSIGTARMEPPPPNIPSDRPLSDESKRTRSKPSTSRVDGERGREVAPDHGGVINRVEELRSSPGASP